MLYKRLGILALFMVAPNFGMTSEAVPEIFGIWGTESQCSGLPIQPGGTVLQSPVEISENWFQQHGIWCRLSWFDSVERADGLYVETRALCGEDTGRGYWLAFDLVTVTDQPMLTVIWDKTIVKGPMQKCTPA